MAKTATLNVRVDPEVKAKAMEVFDELGISASSAINMMLKSVATRRCLPAESVKLEDYGVIDATTMSDDELVSFVNDSIRKSGANDYVTLEDLNESLKRNQILTK